MLAATALKSGTAALDLSTLVAGQHSIVAIYSGDSTHTATQSQPFLLTVSRLTLKANVSPTSFMYGQSAPELSGTLDGILSRDQANVTASFLTTATALSPVGTYTVSIVLAGTASGNYVVAAPPGLAITPADTTTTLSLTTSTLVSGSSIDVGQPLTLIAKVASSTSGLPNGTLNILDGAAYLALEKWVPVMRSVSQLPN